MTSKPKTITEYLTNSPITDGGKLVYPITETHCHLDMLKDVDLDTHIEKLVHLGISRIITISTSSKNFETVKNIQSISRNIFYTLGTHPHEAKIFKNSDVDYIRQTHRESPDCLVAVGEIGLDYHYDFSPREKQIDVFKMHMELAIELDLPVVIHTREADSDMIKILKEFAPKMKKKGVVHSFSSGLDLAQVAANLGFYLGFNGMITFKKAEFVREAVRHTPIEQILVETDSPFLTPHPFRGKPNNPTYIPIVMEEIAKIKDISLPECMKIIESNATQCFF